MDGWTHQPRGFPFPFAPELVTHSLSPKSWHIFYNNKYTGIVSGALVFNDDGHVLLLRRASSDFVPGKWEPPGGMVEQDDQSLLHACARELKEEAGLVPHYMRGAVGEGYSFEGSEGKLYYRFTLLIDVEEGEVKTDPAEHSEYRWATEKEVREEKMADGTEMSITFPAVKEVLLQGLRMKNVPNGH